MRYVAVVFILVAMLVCCCGGVRPPAVSPCDTPPYVVTYEIDPGYYPDEVEALLEAISIMEEATAGSLRFVQGKNPTITYVRARTYKDFPTNRASTNVGLWYNDHAYIAVDQLCENAGMGERRARLVSVFIHESLHAFGGDHYEGRGNSCLYSDMGDHFHCADDGLPKADTDTICARVGCFCGR